MKTATYIQLSWEDIREVLINKWGADPKEFYTINGFHPPDDETKAIIQIELNVREGGRIVNPIIFEEVGPLGKQTCKEKCQALLNTLGPQTTAELANRISEQERDLYRRVYNKVSTTLGRHRDLFEQVDNNKWKLVETSLLAGQ